MSILNPCRWVIEGVQYHHLHVENLQNSLLGIHAGLATYPALPSHYKGIAVYCEWEMEKHIWLELNQNFLQHEHHHYDGLMTATLNHRELFEIVADRAVGGTY